MFDFSHWRETLKSLVEGGHSPQVFDFSFWILATFILYFLVLIVIALLQSRQMQAMSDYVLGSRRMSSFTSALSASSSATSGWTMLVFPALAFSEGAIHSGPWPASSWVSGSTGSYWPRSCAATPSPPRTL